MRVAFIGNIRSGKTTAAQYIEQTYGFERLSFAAPLKQASVSMLRMMQIHIGHEPDFTLTKLEQEKTKPAIRKFLQLIGTDLGREYFGPESLWVDLALQNLDADVDYVLDDCRFLNEVTALRRAGFVVIRIQRPEDDRMFELLDLYGAQRAEEITRHASETELLNYRADATIYAENVETLHAHLKKLLGEPV